MFDLEQAITKWRQQMLAGGIKTPLLLDELESHLRDDFEQRVRLGTAPGPAFDDAVQQIGLARALRLEFAKVGARNWNRKLAFGAWGLYLISFVLPSYAGGFGWQCALLQRDLWDDAIRGHWPSIHYELLTFANLFMLASPFFLYRFGNSTRAMKWFRGLNTSALLLIWSYIGMFFTANDWHDLRVGCFAWGASFGLLLVSTYSRRQERKQFA